MRIHLLVFILVFCGATLHAQDPFRGDEIDGRDFTYNRDYFLNVFSHRFPTGWHKRWREARNGVRAFAGSVRSDEFYTFEEAKFLYDLNDRLTFRFFQEQKEDFDSRYRRIELGLRYRVLDAGRGLYVGMFGEILADKSETDIGFEVLYGEETAGPTRVAFHLVDAYFNEKSSDTFSRYKQKPYSIEIEHWRPILGDRKEPVAKDDTDAEGTEVEGAGEEEAEYEDLGAYGFGWHYNTPLKFSDPDEFLVFDYRKSYLDVFLELNLSPRVSTSLRGFFEDARIVRNFDPGQGTDRDLDRTAAGGEVEVRYDWGDGRELFGGAYVFHLDENNRAPENSFESSDFKQRQYYGFLGLVRPMWWEKSYFRPQLFLGWINNTERFQLNGLRTRDMENKFQGKMNLGFEYRFNPKARFIFNPSIDIDETKFGGGSLVFEISF